jgi:hypothetical protein
MWFVPYKPVEEFLEAIVMEKPFQFLVDLINGNDAQIGHSNQIKHQLFLGVSVLMTRCKGTYVQTAMLEQCAAARIIDTVISHGFKNDVELARQCLYILQFLACENPSFVDVIFSREQHFLVTLLENPQSFFIGLAKTDAVKRLSYLLYTALNNSQHCKHFIENLDNHRGLVQICHTILTLPLDALAPQTIVCVIQPIAKCYKHPQFAFYINKFNFSQVLAQLLEKKSQLGIDEKLENSIIHLKRAILVEQEKANFSSK